MPLITCHLSLLFGLSVPAGDERFDVVFGSHGLRLRLTEQGGGADAVAAVGFGGVQGGVGGVQKLTRSESGCVQDRGNTAADGSEEAGSGHGFERCGGAGDLDEAAHALGDEKRGFVGGLREKENELLAAVAGGEVVFAAQRLTHESGDALDDLIAVEMALGVVDDFEVVDVDDDGRQRLVVASGLPPEQVEVAVEESAIGQLGEGVVRGTAVELDVERGQFFGLDFVAHLQQVVQALIALQRVGGDEKEDGDETDLDRAGEFFRVKKGVVEKEQRKVAGETEERGCDCEGETQSHDDIGDQKREQESDLRDDGEGCGNVVVEDDTGGGDDAGEDDDGAFAPEFRGIAAHEAAGGRQPRKNDEPAHQRGARRECGADVDDGENEEKCGEEMTFEAEALGARGACVGFETVFEQRTKAQPEDAMGPQAGDFAPDLLGIRTGENLSHPWFNGRTRENLRAILIKCHRGIGRRRVAPGVRSFCEAGCLGRLSAPRRDEG